MLTTAQPQGRDAGHDAHHPTRPADAGRRATSSEPPTSLGRIDLPTDYRAEPPRLPAGGGASAREGQAGAAAAPPAQGGAAAAVDDDGYHPVEDDPDLKQRLKAAAQAERIAREIEDIRSRVKGRSQSIARDFDRVLGILEAWGYVEGWALTDAGRDARPHVPRVRSAGRRVPSARACSTISTRRRWPDSYRSSSTSTAAPTRRRRPWFPTNAVRKRWLQIASLSAELQEIEEEDGLVVHRAPDPTFLAIAYAWAAGEGFAEVVEAEELTGGDFVRTMKQLIDLLRQLAIIAPRRRPRGARPSRPPRRCSAAWSRRRARSRSPTRMTHAIATDHEPLGLMTIRRGAEWGTLAPAARRSRRALRRRAAPTPSPTCRRRPRRPSSACSAAT